MGAWFAVPAGVSITKSAEVVTGAIVSTSRQPGRLSRPWAGSARADRARAGVLPEGLLREYSAPAASRPLLSRATGREEDWPSGNISRKLCGSWLLQSTWERIDNRQQALAVSNEAARVQA